ncbi:MAG: hypothetical protein ACFCVA_15530 [Gammaproteobacteria bacterium]
MATGRLQPRAGKRNQGRCPGLVAVEGGDGLREGLVPIEEPRLVKQRLDAAVGGQGVDVLELLFSAEIRTPPDAA